jgi:hypothetical protein
MASRSLLVDIEHFSDITLLCRDGTKVFIFYPEMLGTTESNKIGASTKRIDR